MHPGTIPGSWESQIIVKVSGRIYWLRMSYQQLLNPATWWMFYCYPYCSPEFISTGEKWGKVKTPRDLKFFFQQWEVKAWVSVMSESLGICVVVGRSVKTLTSWSPAVGTPGQVKGRWVSQRAHMADHRHSNLWILTTSHWGKMHC